MHCSCGLQIGDRWWACSLDFRIRHPLNPSIIFHVTARCAVTQVNMRAGVAEPLLARRHVRAVDTCRIGRKECVCKFSNAPTYIVCFCIDQRYIRTQPTSPRPCQQCFLVVLSHVHASWRMWAEGVGVALSRLIWRVGLTGLFTLTGVQLMQYHVSWP